MASKKQVVFLGGKKIGEFGLNFLVENASKFNYEVVGVFPNSSSKLVSGSTTVGSIATNNKIPVFESRNSLFDIEQIDVLISIQYDKILRVDEIDLVKDIAINFHMAPVPEYRGCNQFSFAIAEGVTEFGTTLHRLEAGIDSGDVIAEKRFPIPENCFVQDLHQLVGQKTEELIEESMLTVVTGDYELVSQKELAKTRKSGFHLRSEIDQLKRIDPTWDIEKQKRHFRATWFPPFSPPVNDKTNEELNLDWYNSL